VKCVFGYRLPAAGCRLPATCGVRLFAAATAAGDTGQVLHSSCVAGEESYAARVEKRNKEIAALKEAHGILEDWQ